MSKLIQAIRGMNDILPHEIFVWQYLEVILRDLLTNYGYREIRLPIVESTDLFKRSIGEVTDIVEKEMYTFVDNNGDSLTLRPEGTAGCVRACLEHGLLHNQEQRLFYWGPMFRHERPQKGRYRQFYQCGVEAFGIVGPDIDAELILMTARLWQNFGFTDALELQLNSLGTLETRNRYRHVLVEYLQKHAAQLDADSQRRLATNPLRILDSKNPSMAELIQQAPKLADYLDDESRQHFAKLCRILDAAKINYTLNPRLVRGLDYYGKTVFEWVTNTLGAQGTVCAGGRYDGLVEQLGGKPTPAVGFAIGIERLIIMFQQNRNSIEQKFPHAYLISIGETAELQAPLLAEQLRQKFPTLRLIQNVGGGSFKSQFKRADKSGAQMALILGDDEIKNKTISVKYLLQPNESQKTLTQAELESFLNALIS